MHNREKSIVCVGKDSMIPKRDTMAACIEYIMYIIYFRLSYRTQYNNEGMRKDLMNRAISVKEIQGEREREREREREK